MILPSNFISYQKKQDSYVKYQNTHLVNRVPYLRDVLRNKDRLCTTLPGWIAKIYAFPCWVLPSRRNITHIVLSFPNQLWIAKPFAGGGGRGVYVLPRKDLTALLSQTEPILLQPLLENPLLVQHRKFDLRVYVLVTSINPLRVFVHSRPYARLAAEAYASSGSKTSQVSLALSLSWEEFLF
jgi:hypothetical protein